MKNERRSKMNGQEVIGQITRKEMPDFEQVRVRCITQTAPKKTARRLALVTSIVLVFILATTGFAIATDGFKFLFDAFAERASMSTRINEHKDTYNADVLIKDYTLAFSNMDEIRDLFNITIGNPYMDISLGNPYNSAEQPHMGRLCVSEFSTGETAVRIDTRFAVNGCVLDAEIWVPLIADENWGVAYADYHDADPAIKYLYESDNGIIARVVLDESESPDWTLNLRFVYGGAFYIIESSNLVQTVDGQIDIKTTVAAFVDSFVVG